MTRFELMLRALPVEWPATPDVAARLELAPRRRPPLMLAVAIAAAVAVAFLVPQSRSAILDFFHLGGVTIQHVDTLPPAEERPLAAGLGPPVDDATAARVIGVPFLPASHGSLYQRGGFISTLVAVPQPALLTEFGNGYLLKKLSGASGVENVEIAPGVPGLWIAGAPHVVLFPNAPPRLAGNVLVWARGGVTFRLEANDLEQANAIRVARELLGTGSG